MSDRAVYLMCASLVLGLGLAGTARAGLVGWWEFEEGAGATVADSSGNGNAGTVNGGTWQEGKLGGGIYLDGADDYVEIPNILTESCTLAFWFKPDWDGTDAEDYRIFDASLGAIYFFISKGANHADINPAEFGLYFEDASDADWQDIEFDPADVITADTWFHCVATWEFGGGYAYVYINGEELGTSPNALGGFPALHQNPRFGLQTIDYIPSAHGAAGVLDDARIYDRILTPKQAEDLFNGIDPDWRKAENPSPPDGAQGVSSPLFTWGKGETALFHNVYFGADPENLSQVAVNQPFEVYYRVEPLVPGMTYYWRVDEVEPDMTTIHTGDVWSFTVTPTSAWNPDPADEGEGAFPAPTLAWNAGQNAREHHVYFGGDKAAVAAADPATDQGLTGDTTWTAPVLRSSTTYYWRVDETLIDGTVVEGEVWSFTTADGARNTVARQVWMGITGTAVRDLESDPRYPNAPSTQELVGQFDGPVDWANGYGIRMYGWLIPPESGDYTFWVAGDDNHSLRLSTDEDPANAEEIATVPGYTAYLEWTKYPEQESAPVALVAGKKYYLEVLGKEGGGGDSTTVAWQGGPIMTRTIISAEYVDTFVLPALTAFSPSPANGAVDTIQSLALTWAAGENATQHDVYFGDDKAAVAAADTTTADIYRGRQAGTSYNPGALEWGKAHYWRIDEIEADGTVRPGRVWTFTTADFIPIDDFETYTNEVGSRIFQTWIDGLGFSEPAPGNPGNGSAAFVGHDVWTPGTPYTTIVETGTVQSGNQSMPLYVNNSTSPYYSETDRTFAPAMDWTAGGVTDLSIWVHGDVDNTPDQLYIGLSSGGAPVVVNAAPDVVMSTEWVEVKIPLADFAGVNLGSVRQMIIGVGNRAAPVAGGDSLVFIDNIRVLKPEVASP